MNTATAHAILLLSGSDETESAVTTALAETTHYTLAGRCTSADQMAESLDRLRPPLMLADVDADPPRMLEELAVALPRFPDLRCIVLSSAADHGLIIRAMEAGARCFVAKENIPSQLLATLQRLSPGAGGRRGKVVTVLSASGGCGATTVAVNLAHELTLRGDRPAVLVDMDCAYESMGAYLGLESIYGLGSVLEYPGAIDTELVLSSASPWREGLGALINPVTSRKDHPERFCPACPVECQWERLPAVLESCRRAYAWTVVDAPRLSVDQAGRLVRMSDRTLLLLQLSVKDIRLARALMKSLEDIGLPGDRLTVLANRFDKRRSMITLEEAKASLACGQIQTLSEDFANVIQGVNLGQPLAEITPRSSFRKDIRALAERIATTDAAAPQRSAA